ncbi:MAG: NUDIX hydrolase [Thermomicrobiales bacterium]|nr:NUDIX hydrolase [Thermomicrobiales bacterium]
MAKSNPCPATAPVVTAPAAGVVESRPDLDLRVVLFTVTRGRLLVALLPDSGGYRLPRSEPRPGGGLDGEARRIVRERTGFADQYLEQLYTLSVGTGADWTVVVSYLALILSAGETPPAGPCAWRDPEADLLLDATDAMVLGYALKRLRAKLGYTTIAFHLLPPTFTLSALQAAYEAILARSLDKRNFRRQVIAAGFLESTGKKHRDGSHRPALLYRFRAGHDPEAYLTPPWSQADADPEADARDAEPAPVEEHQ